MSIRWEGIKRPYTTEDVYVLQGSVGISYTLAEIGANKLWNKLCNTSTYINALGALTGNQAMQQAKAGLDAVYLSGWQVAADANDSLEMYPDQSLYAVSSVPTIIKRINNTFIRADQIQHMELENELLENEKNSLSMDYGRMSLDYFLPIIADAESGFGGVLNTHELVKKMIEAGAAGIHLEDQLASVKKCGHMGGKVLISTQEMINKLVAARLASDIMDVPIIIIARTDALAGALLQSDNDVWDSEFIIRKHGGTAAERTKEGFYRTKAGMSQAV